MVLYSTDLLHTLDQHQTGRLHPASSTRLLRGHKAFLYRLQPVPVSTEDRTNHHHSGCVNRLCWSPNGGSFLASVSDDRTIRVWVLNIDQVLERYRTFSTLHQGNVFGIRFLDSNPDQLRFGTILHI
jgi:WD40 repeat protein